MHPSSNYSDVLREISVCRDEMTDPVTKADALLRAGGTHHEGCTSMRVDCGRISRAPVRNTRAQHML